MVQDPVQITRCRLDVGIVATILRTTTPLPLIAPVMPRLVPDARPAHPAFVMSMSAMRKSIMDKTMTDKTMTPASSGGQRVRRDQRGKADRGRHISYDGSVAVGCP